MVPGKTRSAKKRRGGGSWSDRDSWSIDERKLDGDLCRHRPRRAPAVALRAGAPMSRPRRAGCDADVGRQCPSRRFQIQGSRWASAHTAQRRRRSKAPGEGGIKGGVEEAPPRVSYGEGDKEGTTKTAGSRRFRNGKGEEGEDKGEEGLGMRCP